MVSQPNNKQDKVEARKRLFATRFKTEMCRTYSAEGACPYEGRCMFAHGAGDLRTEAMNERDGLTSALAVREWLDVISGVNSSVESGTPRTRSDSSSASMCDESAPRSPPMLELCTAALPTTAAAAAGAVELSLRPKAKAAVSWRHEPYSWVMPFVGTRGRF